ncbi:MAG: 16S rRNA (guanine(527)-N(7))-methyltransferase RsmG [Bacteroidaceae bacterium]|nr:16S rRNA (guanine(527)-N(7))-methyltransferase RsmG [Bacteroidaceae bacterium]MBQ9175260.1 16S rRNA (guanine(527)-N(7))-methyltransferase RsmG [Bacteroidaceae bacterium]
MDIILKYFPDLSDTQRRQFAMLQSLYEEWNARINVISRKDIGNLYEHHVLHSLGIAKVISFTPGSRVMDLGCGGGFPGIPLAIMYPEVHFHLVDSIGKKVRVAQEVAAAIELKNVELTHARGEEIKTKYDFVVTRAVMPLTDLMKCVRKNIATAQHNALPNGIIALKGGELSGEIAPMRTICTEWNLSDYFDEEYFETKKVVHVRVKN